MKDMEALCEKAHKLINKLILRSKYFCDFHSVPDGLSGILMVYSKTGYISENELYSSKLSYDYDYFAFTKSTKSLIAIKELLKNKEYNFNEDSFMLIRSIFENHIMSRYVREHIDIESERKNVIEKFIINPLAVTFNYFTLEGNKIINNKGEKNGQIIMPHRYKMGYEERYYSDLYQFLCQYTHCSFGALTCYYDNELYTYRKENFRLLTLLLAIFCFTKIYEGVVTVNGEDLGDSTEEKRFYDTAYDSLELQLELFDYLIAYYDNKPREIYNVILEKYLGEDSYDNMDKKVVEMLKKLKESIFDYEIGSLNKKTIDEKGKFKRVYPDYE
ncbi:hypothetical protein [Clostridium perfringens]|uniref:hypothetical protein n=1 Tax=Clostridium perfringens TaxID=1502 RepID=UPI0039E847A8